MLPRRAPESHKGENGRVLIIGGSIDYFGAPILAGLGALGAGADKVCLLVPECNFEISRSFYPDFIVRKYPGNYINSRTLDYLDLLEKTDCVLIGPGVSEDPESLRIITRIIQKTQCDIVLDAEAIPAIASLGLSFAAHGAIPFSAATSRKITITPHRGELNEITHGDLPDDFDELVKITEETANRFGVTVLLKGRRDVIAAPGMPARINETGNAGMTVGGSGDVIAGCTASLIAQHISPFNASCAAAFTVGAAGDNLMKQKSYNFTATDIALELPYAIHGIL